MARVSHSTVMTARLVLAAGICGLTGCAPGPKFPPVCPNVKLVGEAADMTRFNGQGHDINDIVLDGRLDKIVGGCKAGDPGQLITQIQVGGEVSLGPGAKGRTADFAYFVAVAKGEQILDKQIYTEHAEFPSNVNRLRLTGEQIDLQLPISATVSGAAYTIFAGFQLTPEELEFNRKRGVR
jgi:hypothetical protein